jgi:Fe-S cluster assembly protein SufD
VRVAVSIARRRHSEFWPLGAALAQLPACHGATVGQLDERSLFYLRSRGIPLAEARALLTAAFCRAMLDDLPNPELREHLASLLIAQLPE